MLYCLLNIYNIWPGTHNCPVNVQCKNSIDESLVVLETMEIYINSSCSQVGVMKYDTVGMKDEIAILRNEFWP